MVSYDFLISGGCVGSTTQWRPCLNNISCSMPCLHSWQSSSLTKNVIFFYLWSLTIKAKLRHVTAVGFRSLILLISAICSKSFIQCALWSLVCFETFVRLHLSYSGALFLTRLIKKSNLLPLLHISLHFLLRSVL